MAPRFDEESLTLELSVADLIDARLRRNLGFANRGGYERLWMGQAIHSRYQEEALHQDPSYQREVTLTLTLPHRGWEVRVQGRADGLRREEDGTLVVEEIKSVRRGGQLAPQTREIYERQALIYAWMLARAGEERVRAELILIEIGSDYADREPLPLDEAKMDALVRKRVNSLLREFETSRQATADRQAAARALSFPFPAKRHGQEQMLEEVARTLDQREHLLLEAPTGIGKTVGALLPALRYALENDKRIFVLTAKTLQQKMANQVLTQLNSDRAFNSLQLRAKAKMCANGEVLCHEEFCPFAKDYYLKLHQRGVVAQLLGDEATLLPDRVFELAREDEVCPFEVSLELAGHSQVVVCDYNYAFDPYVSLTDFADESDLGDTILLIDEIHNLLDRGRGYYSPELSARAAAEAADAVGRGRGSVHQRAAGICASLARLIESTVGAELDDAGDVRAVEALLPEDQLWALRTAFDEAFVDYIEHQRETSTFQADDSFVSFYFDFLRFLNGLVISESEAFNHCVERQGRDSKLRVLCKDPGRFLGKVINRVHSAIGFSATLSPPEFYRDLLGFDSQRTSFLSLPSPFPSENRRVVIDDSVSTLYRERQQNYRPIAEQLSALATSVPGNCMALFPSYHFLSEVHDRVAAPGRRILAQSRGDSDGQRDAILEALRSPLAGDCLLLAVAGGVFAEGVDYPGEMLSAVAIVGPCLPAVTLDQQLLSKYYEERFERGFEYSFVVPGMTRVVQAAGRLIRSPQDIGVIALLDRRFLWPPYRDHLPGDWLDGDAPEALVGRPSKVAEAFFREL